MNRHVRPQSDGERRSFVLSAVVRALGVAALDFVLLRIWAPDLVDQHQDLALAGAIGCVVLALVVTGWWGLRLWSDLSHRRAGRTLPAPREIED